MINFYLDQPFLTVEQYAQKIGKTPAAVKKDIEKGYIPVYQPVKGSTYYVNMVGLVQMAQDIYEHQKRSAPWAVNTGIR